MTSGFVFPRGQIAVRPQNVILAPLRNGASQEMAVDGSETPVVFRYACSPGVVLYVERLVVAYADTATPTAAKYGGRLELVNGVSLGVYTGEALVLDLAPGNAKSNADWGKFACARESREDYGAGDNFWSYCFTWESASILALQPGQEVRATVADNLAPLTTHAVILKGYTA